MQIEATIVEKETIAPAWWRVTLHAPELTDRPVAGQFLLVDCDGTCYLRRAIFPEFLDDGYLRLLLQPNPDPGLAWLLARTVGDTLDLLGPLGMGFPTRPTSTNLLLVSDNTTLSPLLDQMQRALNSDSSVTLALEGHRASKIYPASLLPARVEIHLATRSGTLGQRGPVSDLLPELLSWADYVCSVGSPDLYRTILQLTEQVRFGVHSDFLYGLATNVWLPCGVGACFGCTVKTGKGVKLVCIDGPVFDLAELIS